MCRKKYSLGEKLQHDNAVIHPFYTHKDDTTLGLLRNISALVDVAAGLCYVVVHWAWVEKLPNHKHRVNHQATGTSLIPVYYSFRLELDNNDLRL